MWDGSKDIGVDGHAYVGSPCVGPSGNLTFDLKRHIVNSSSLILDSGCYKEVSCGKSLVLTLLLRSHVSAMQITVGIRTTRPIAGISPSHIPHFGLKDDISYPRRNSDYDDMLRLHQNSMSKEKCWLTRVLGSLNRKRISVDRPQFCWTYQ